MRVLVASQNEIKRLATEDAYRDFNDGHVPEVVSAHREIKSDVEDQPTSIPMGEEGVENRINNAKVLVPGKFAAIVAIEGTCFRTRNGWYETAIAGVRENGRVHYGHGPSYPVPEDFVRLLKQGKDLNDIMKQETGIENAGSTIGFNGWLAGKEHDRRAASKMAVYLALCGMKAEKR